MLEWVHHEIAAFGGDPGRITVMGESAGAANVAGLLARDGSRALVDHAIIESGPLQAQTATKVGRVTAQLAKRLGVKADRESFVALTPEQLLEARRAQSAGSSPLGDAPRFQFAIDEDSLPRSPHEVLGEIDTPLLIGSNTDEYRLWCRPEALAGISELKLRAARLLSRVPAVRSPSIDPRSLGRAPARFSGASSQSVSSRTTASARRRPRSVS